MHRLWNHWIKYNPSAWRRSEFYFETVAYLLLLNIKSWHLYSLLVGNRNSNSFQNRWIEIRWNSSVFRQITLLWGYAANYGAKMKAIRAPLMRSDSHGQNMSNRRNYLRRYTFVLLRRISILNRKVPSRHQTLTECWFDVGPPPATLSQH